MPDSSNIPRLRKPPPPRGPAKTVILIVDDKADILDVLPRLVPPSMRCITALSCAPAFEVIASSDRLHGLVVDVRLPDGSGLDIVDRWVAKFPSAPAVIMTGFYDTPDAANHAYLNSCRFLPKPFGAEAFALFILDVQTARWDVPRVTAARFDAFALRHELTDRQGDLFAMHVRGVPRSKMAEQLGVEPSTLRTLVEQLCDKVGVKTLDAMYAKMMAG